MNTFESMTPREASSESAQNLKYIRFASLALRQAHEVIERSTTNAQDESLDSHRRSIGEWHVKYWNERIIPEREKDLIKLEEKATRDYQKNQEAYYNAALAEALLDGVDIAQ